MILTTYLFWTSVILVLIYLVKNVISSLITSYHIAKLPAPAKYNWILGNIGHLATDPATLHKILRQWATGFYPIYNVWGGWINIANIISPEDFELVSANINHIKKGYIYRLIDQWLKTGLLTSDGKKWQRRRKLLTPAFHFSILQGFIPIFNRDTEELVQTLEDECGKEFTEINSFISDFTLKAIAETSMGTRLDFKSEKERRYRHNIHDLVKIFLHRICKPILFSNLFYFFSPSYHKEKKIVKSLHKFTQEVISKRQKDYFDSYQNDSMPKKKKLAMLDLLLEAKNRNGLIDDEGIREEVDTFMFEGHDTIAGTLCFTLMLLANHKQAQDLILDEMIGVFGGDLKKKPTYTDLQELKYLERCIKESLRLYPIAFFISRELGDDLRTHSGYFLKKGSMIVVHIYDIHHNPDIYPDPEKFDPDRFLPENVAKRHPFAFVPFSAGPRNCIGQRYAILEMKSVLCGILSNFVLEPVDTQESTILISDIILRTKDPIKVKFVKRSV